MSMFLNVLIVSVHQLLEFYFILLLCRITFSWFPIINWYQRPWYILILLVDPYLRVFRGFIPPFLGIDFSPMAGFILIQYLLQLLNLLTIKPL
jgi:YggT family protein